MDDPDNVVFFAPGYTVSCHDSAVPIFKDKNTADQFWHYINTNHSSFLHYDAEPTNVFLPGGTLLCRRETREGDRYQRGLRVYKVREGGVRARLSSARALPREAILLFGDDVNGGDGGGEQLTILRGECGNCIREIDTTHLHHQLRTATNPDGLLFEHA